ncbi:hypothetical protein [Leptospira barantonii]|uniref:7TM-DISM receptor extracellular domain-containing protein n=1 Tax=Leptospira barantonii TaxID=2023184 RepID=A0ABX4NKW8_9LEPT|nr:hypothetical protein [Leptospira barantonii]PJZ56924.1 hypothetical protein CH367_12550 [Leptospira barantonii]
MKTICRLKITIIILLISGSLFSQASMSIHPNLIFIEKLPTARDVLALRINYVFNNNKLLDKRKFLTLFDKAEPIQPKDEILKNWHYSPWCTIEFLTSSGSYELKLYLGGLGFLTLPNGKTGAMLLDLNGK